MRVWMVKHGNKHIDCAPPHDHPNEEWHKLMVKPILPEIGGDTVKTAAETALNELFLTWKQKLGQDILPDAVIETLRSVPGVYKHQPFE